MSFLYLLCLCVGLAGLTMIDWRYKLLFFYEWRRACRVLCLGLVIFLIWDVLGVQLDIFFVGEARYLTGLRVLPEVPIEELFFLSLLTYNALIVWRFCEVKWRGM